MRSSFEIERRFLVKDRSVIDGSAGDIIIQAYLFSNGGYVVRVRRTHTPTGGSGVYDEGPAILTVKGPRDGPMRQEYEMEIPNQYATDLIQRSDVKLSKVRYQIIDNERLWDVDVFNGSNDGLIIAECEGHRALDAIIPHWCGAEVTDDRRYDNEALAAEPYSNWGNP